MSTHTPRHAKTDQTPRPLDWLTPARRRWLYAVITAAMPVLITYGYLEQETAPQWLAVFASMLGTSTALLHTPRGEQ